MIVTNALQYYLELLHLPFGFYRIHSQDFSLSLVPLSFGITMVHTNTILCWYVFIKNKYKHLTMNNYKVQCVIQLHVLYCIFDQAIWYNITFSVQLDVVKDFGVHFALPNQISFGLLVSYLIFIVSEIITITNIVLMKKIVLL